MAGREPGDQHGNFESKDGGVNVKEEDSDGDKDMDMNGVPFVPVLRKERSVVNGRSGTLDPGQSEPKHQFKSEGESSLPTNMPETDSVGATVELKMEPGKGPKLMRKASQKVIRRPPPLYLDLEDKTSEATSTFSLLTECVYANRYMGSTEAALECDCSEEWNSVTRTNDACGEDSDCINRATKMECANNCGCGDLCQNQRFTRKQWADVTVIKTDKKGYGLRTNVDMRPHEFIFEYIGEVIGENAFHRRRQQYHDEGIKHFYFMSLTKGEFVDATKRGNLGRFCNHSCNPNCYVDKWVVGDKLRMGIFAERSIKAGEELVFNYNVDRYGADPQPCYCDEPNCTGYIGGRTQTERATKLSHATIEALGIDDADAWDTVVAKRPKKKKSAGDDDEEYVNHFEPRGLDEEGVNKVMSSLMQCKEKWIAVKLLARIQRADDEKVRNRVVRFHGYRVLKTALTNFSDDVNVCLQVLDVLDKLPRLTLNKIRGSKIEDTIQEFTTNEDERVATQSKELLNSWAQLKMEYRIPKREPGAAGSDRKVERVDRRDSERRRSRSRSRTKSPERIVAPTGPRGKVLQRNPAYLNGPRPPPRFRPPPPGALPAGWFAATAQNGSVYYYNQTGTATWERPMMPAKAVPPPPPSKAQTDQQIIQNLIQSIVTKKEPAKQLPSGTNTPGEAPQKDQKEEKWRNLPEEKKKKLYEAALQPHMMPVVNKYKHKLAKDDLKRWAKELAKKIVESDFKKGRVDNPTKISDKHAKGVKKHAQDFFEKAVKKKEAADRRRADKKAATNSKATQSPVISPVVMAESPAAAMDMTDSPSDDAMDGANGSSTRSPTGSAAPKRVYDDIDTGCDEQLSPKKQRTESTDDEIDPPPPPPPPPPPRSTDLELLDRDVVSLTSGEDVTGSFTHEALPAVDRATLDTNVDSTTDHRHSSGHEAINGFATGHVGCDSHHDPYHHLQLKSTPIQVATPPTTGSPDPEGLDKSDKLQQFTASHLDPAQKLSAIDEGQP